LPWSWRRACSWRSPEPRALRREVSVGRAGSRRRPGSCGSVGRRARLHPALERLDDAHAPAAAGTRWAPIERFWRFDRLWRRRGHGKQFAGAGYIGLACGTGEQAVMADAVEATWQDMEQEAADELVRRERHHALPFRTIAAVVLTWGASGQGCDSFVHASARLFVSGSESRALLHDAARFRARSTSHTVAAQDGCTNIPLAAAGAQAGETILIIGVSGHGLPRFVHPDPPELIRSWKI